MLGDDGGYEKCRRRRVSEVYWSSSGSLMVTLEMMRFSQDR